jgi:iron complex outermembrane recepter protein
VDERTATQARQGLQLDEALNRIPGVFAQNRYNFAQDVRLSIRGFGARAPFGIRGLRILQDGIPETTPDGQSQVDAIDLLNVSRIEVLRGPNAALYGNATGGVVAITTRDGSDPRGHGGGALLGSYGFQRVEAQRGTELAGSYSLRGTTCASTATAIRRARKSACCACTSPRPSRQAISACICAPSTPR